MNPRILSFGIDHALVSSRALILSGAGYEVEEAYSADVALKLIELGSIDLMLICHTVPFKVMRLLVAMVQTKRQLMPVLFIRSFPHQNAPPNCIAIENDTEFMLNAIAKATKRPAALK
jgi:DNA-binding response OmpR family regulator